MSKVGVIVSTIAGSARNKCYSKVKSREVFMRSLDLFITRDDVCATILAVGEDKAEQVKQKYGPHLAFASVKVVAGKDHFSAVAAALQNIAAGADLIAIHDAARPAVSPMQIDELIETAAKDGAAILAAPLRQIVKRVSKEQKVLGPVETGDLWMAQTPQVFSAKLLREAYAKRDELGQGFADDAELLAAAGTWATVIAGSWRNIRVATNDDLTVAAPLIDAVPKRKLQGPTGPYAEDKMW